MAGVEVGAVAAEHGDPLSPGLGQVLGDQVGGVGSATAGHPDVSRRRAGVLADHHMRRRDGGTLHPVRGAGVGQLHVGGDVTSRLRPC
jgi:hypothetical protein